MKISPVILFLILLLAACGIPSDMADSWEEARSTQLSVGLIDNPPYATYGSSGYMGAEVEYLKEFARFHNIDIQFSKGHESALFEKLKKRELHVVAGGIQKTTVWKKHAGMTCPYDGKHVFAVPMGENRLLYQLDSYIFKRSTHGKSSS